MHAGSVPIKNNGNICILHNSGVAEGNRSLAATQNFENFSCQND